MIRADSKPTTSRRGFLARGAATVAGASLLATPALPALTSPAGADPIFDAIEKHKVAYAALSAAVHQHDHHEDEHTERDLDLAHDAEIDAACELLVVPSTMAGVIALLTYATSAAQADDWPTGLVEDDGKREHSWEFFAMCNCREALESLAVASLARPLENSLRRRCERRRRMSPIWKNAPMPSSAGCRKHLAISRTTSAICRGLRFLRSSSFIGRSANFDWRAVNMLKYRASMIPNSRSSRSTSYLR